MLPQGILSHCVPVTVLASPRRSCRFPPGLRATLLPFYGARSPPLSSCLGAARVLCWAGLQGGPDAPRCLLLHRLALLLRRPLHLLLSPSSQLRLPGPWPLLPAARPCGLPFASIAEMLVHRVWGRGHYTLRGPNGYTLHNGSLAMHGGKHVHVRVHFLLYPTNPHRGSV